MRGDEKKNGGKANQASFTALMSKCFVDITKIAVMTFGTLSIVLLHNCVLYLQLFVREVLSQLFGHSLQVPEWDLARLVIIKQAESFQDLFFGVLLGLKSEKGESFSPQTAVLQEVCSRLL